MKDFLFLPLGTAGDVLPFCALGRQMTARGHQVTVAANPHFRQMIERAGVDFLPVGTEAEYQQLIEGSPIMSRTFGFSRLMRWVSTLVEPIYDLCARRSSIVVAHPLAFGARVAEAHLGVRTCTLLLSPAILQSAHEPPVMPSVINSRAFPSWYKRSVWWAVDRLILDPMIAPTLNALRQRVGIGPLTRVFQQGWNSDHLFLALFPEWFAPRQPDWPRNLVYTGFPLYDGEGEAPTLDGELVFTPGTGNRRAREFFEAAIDASERLGLRAILLTRFAEQLPNLPAHARHLEYAPLGKLLSGGSALIHHGGIGTSAAALAAAVPQVLTPFAHDQPDNAARLCRLGVAEAVRPRGRAMARALERLLESAAVAKKCRELAARTTPSLMEAAAALEDYSAEAAA